MSKVLSVTSHSEDETLALAAKLAATFRPGDVLILTGVLGAGKTIFVRGLATALGLEEDEVNSPSYTLVNEYSGEHPLYHFDLYRLGEASELREIGWEDYLNREGLVVVEWGEKAGGYLPASYYLIEFKIIDDESREINLSYVSQ